VAVKRPDPKVSIVATTRNDDHGGNQLARTQLFIEGLAEQSRLYKLPVELLMVEWNPPSDRAPLADALKWPRSEWFDPTVVTVGPDLHRAFAHAEALPLFQMIAKNVGIRRASARFVLATNIDILFSDELFAFFNDLKPGVMYRVDRLDVVADLDRKPIPSAAECRALPWMRAHREGGTDYPDGRRPTWYAAARSRFNRAAWNALHGGALPTLHTQACGDFTLTTREAWFEMRGYPEWPIYSWQLDGLPMYQALAGGVAMINLSPPMVAYHLEHGAGSGWTPEGARRLFRRLDEGGIPYLTSARYHRLAQSVLRKGPGFHPFNSGEWGLASEDLPVVKPG